MCVCLWWDWRHVCFEASLLRDMSNKTNLFTKRCDLLVSRWGRTKSEISIDITFMAYIVLSVTPLHPFRRSTLRLVITLYICDLSLAHVVCWCCFLLILMLSCFSFFQMFNAALDDILLHFFFLSIALSLSSRRLFPAASYCLFVFFSIAICNFDVSCLLLPASTSNILPYILFRQFINCIGFFSLHFLNIIEFIAYLTQIMFIDSMILWTACKFGLLPLMTSSFTVVWFLCISPWYYLQLNDRRFLGSTDNGMDQITPFHIGGLS